MYSIVGGAVTYGIKGIGIFEWFWAQGQGLVGLILKASKIEIAITSVSFSHVMKPLENITSPRYFLPLALGLDFFRICCSLGVNANNKINDYSRFATIKKVAEIITGYLIGYVVTLGYVNCFVTVNVVTLENGENVMVGLQEYGVILKCCLVSVFGCCVSEGICRFVLGII